MTVQPALPTSIALRNYRSFVGTHELELRPLTLVYGRNNVGKSALVRLLQLLSDSVSPQALGALHLESAALFGAGFDDLKTKFPQASTDDDPSLGLRLRWENQPIDSVEYAFEWLEPQGLLVRDFSVERSTGERVDFQRVPAPKPDNPALHDFDVIADSKQSRVPFELRGLIPHNVPQPFAPLLTDVRAQLEHLSGNVQWLSSQRRIHERRFAQPPARRLKIAHDGHDTPQVLWSSAELRAQVSRWFEDSLSRSVEVKAEPPDEFRCQLRNAQHSQPHAFDLIDSGSGLMQILPVVTCAKTLTMKSGPRLLAAEEPGMNLDPRTQYQLAELLCRIAVDERAPRLLIETHSQALLLGVQLAVARQEIGLAPEDVVLYWVRQDDFGKSSLERVTLDSDGRPSAFWPDPFSPLRELARELVSVRQQRGSRK